MTKLEARGKEALSDIPSKLVLNIDTPIFTMNNGPVLHSAVLHNTFSSEIPLFHKRHHATRGCSSAVSAGTLMSPAPHSL